MSEDGHVCFANLETGEVSAGQPGHFKACMTEIYLHIDARMADYIRTWRQRDFPCGGCTDRHRQAQAYRRTALHTPFTLGITHK